ncbi:MAG: hypothetical protein HY718_03315 [Planctomycetes bacterium]|nr:hypothetical protein [Planctomycetota bacterium]
MTAILLLLYVTASIISDPAVPKTDQAVTAQPTRVTIHLPAGKTTIDRFLPAEPGKTTDGAALYRDALNLLPADSEPPGKEWTSGPVADLSAETLEEIESLHRIGPHHANLTLSVPGEPPRWQYVIELSPAGIVTPARTANPPSARTEATSGASR